MNALYTQLRLRYPNFEYQAFHHTIDKEGLHIWFDFRMGDIEFHPHALIERRSFLNLSSDPEQLDRLVFDIGMAELVSYWKCACPPEVNIRCGSLTPEQISFWLKLYWNGLGEFFYTNDITEATPADFMQIIAPSAGRPSVFNAGGDDNNNSYLVPIGGGKDSVVTLELLRRAEKSVRPLIMNPRGATTACAKMAGFDIDEVLCIRRQIDPTLLDLNKQGYLNGHTPFSAMLAFYTRLASTLSGINQVALSNENSANESTVPGSTINHQYSKSLEFEDDFREYTKGESFRYFSFLRPLSELQIALLFSEFEAYHNIFRSCNVGSKSDIWCGHCAKCLFAYIILSPFLAPKRLQEIFGRNLLDDAEMSPLLQQLVGKASTKPFECIGTIDEVKQALWMTASRWYREGQRPLLISGAEPVNTSIPSIADMGNLNPTERQILSEALNQAKQKHPF